jgi:enterochelin esterase-like enzyme
VRKFQNISCAILAILWLSISLCVAQDYREFSSTLRALSTDSAQSDSVWNSLIAQHRIPFIVEDSVAFLYKGEAKSVKWMGDFNRWGYDKKFITEGKLIGSSDIWIFKTTFPKDARLDYKIVVDEQWILDPRNENVQWSGVGGGSPNSELRMPAWKADAVTIYNEATKKGTVSADILFNSKVLGYQLSYSTYVPAGFDAKIKGYPVLYVTDGYEYRHEKMGNMITIVDNLIATGKIKPIVIVFVDHREPAYRSNNRRMNELAMNEKYLKFFTEELIPEIEKQHPVTGGPEQRGILGTSMGGLTAAYFAFSRPDIFGLAGIQSPAFWFRPEIYTLCDNQEKPPVKIYMTSGVINDSKEGVEKMKKVLEKNTCTFQYKEVNQGHSWGNWKDLIDDILIYFFPLN